MGFLTSLLGQSTVQAVGAGVLSGALGGAALIATGVIPIPAEVVTLPTIELRACPGEGPVLAEVSDGERLLVTARSADGQWLEVYIGQPGIDRAWTDAPSLVLETPGDDLPVAGCEAPLPGPLPSPPPTVVAPTPTAGPTLGPTPSPTPLVTPSPTPVVTATVGATPTPTPKPTPTPTPKPTKIPTPPPPTPTPTPQPTPNPGPNITGLNASPHSFCQGPTSEISLYATDPQGVQVVRITYTPPGASPIGPVTMDARAEDLWTFDITPNGWNAGYVAYTVTAIDNFGASSSQSSVNDDTHPTYLVVPSFC